MNGDNVMDKTMINTDIRIFEFVMGFYEAKAEEDFKELCRSTYGENHNKEYRFELALCQWASDKAYRDFCRTIKFKEPDTDNARMKKRMEATGIICEKIRELTADTDYDKWHEDVCEEIQKEYKNFINDTKHGNDTLTVGQIQKWLNMTIKWLWMYNSCVKNIEYFKGIIDHTKDLHIPLDSYILAYIKKELGLGLEESSAWSQISKYDDVYLKYQTEFKTKLTSGESPIEWELVHWKEALNMNIK